MDLSQDPRKKLFTSVILRRWCKVEVPPPPAVSFDSLTKVGNLIFPHVHISIIIHGITTTWIKEKSKLHFSCLDFQNLSMSPKITGVLRISSVSFPKISHMSTFTRTYVRFLFSQQNDSCFRFRNRKEQGRTKKDSLNQLTTSVFHFPRPACFFESLTNQPCLWESTVKITNLLHSTVFKLFDLNCLQTKCTFLHTNWWCTSSKIGPTGNFSSELLLLQNILWLCRRAPICQQKCMKAHKINVSAKAPRNQTRRPSLCWAILFLCQQFPAVLECVNPYPYLCNLDTRKFVMENNKPPQATCQVPQIKKNRNIIDTFSAIHYEKSCFYRPSGTVLSETGSEVAQVRRVRAGPVSVRRVAQPSV